VKLVQLNAWGGRLEHLIEDFLEAERPDLLCLQEVISFSAAQRSGLFVTLENIQRQYDLPHEGFGPVFSFDYMNGTAKFGNAILSRMPIQRNETVFTHMEHTDNFVWGDPGNNARNFVHAVIEVDGRQCHVITHHGYWVRNHKNGTEETIEQVQQIADYIAGLSGPVILTGDFNLVPDSKSLQPLNKLLRNLSADFKLTTTRNQLTFKTEVCDYIFVNQEVNVENFKASSTIVSDHQALILEFSL
jgi:endonuclease/exonuclease/phosphatase family metal-dependent hydrolase